MYVFQTLKQRRNFARPFFTILDIRQLLAPALASLKLIYLIYFDTKCDYVKLRPHNTSLFA